MELEWDAGKATLNLKKHGVSFEDAELVFYDSGRIEAFDGWGNYGELDGPRLALRTRLCSMWSTPSDMRTPFVLSLRGKPMRMKEGNIVKRTLDLKNPPALSSEQMARLNATASMSDDLIDYSDAPYREDALWMKAADELPQTKRQITLRIDAEVLEFFKSTGTRYQSRMNAVLRSYVEAHKPQPK